MQLQVVVPLTLTFYLLAAFLQPPLCVAEQVYYVIPDSETTCPSTPCHNITHYIHYLLVYFQSNSTFKFLPGVHILNAGGVIKIEFANNIALTGDPTMLPSESEFPFQPSSKIWCTGQAGFAFMFVENLLIENLTFTNCGTPLSSHSNWSSAILFSYVTNLTISRVVVQNTTGYGILGLALKGHSSIFESTFLCNHGDENHLIGGNIYLKLDRCSRPGNSTSVSLNIWSTYVLYGDSPQLDFPTGLTVILDSNLCTNTYLILDNVTVSHNKNGNLFLSLSYSDTASVSVTIENSRIEGGSALPGGGYIMMVEDSSQFQLHDCPNAQTSNPKSTLRIFNTTVTRNSGQGVMILVSPRCTNPNIEINRVMFSENNSSLGFQTRTKVGGSGVVSEGGAALNMLGISSFEVCPRQSINHDNIMIKISNTVVTKNTGGGVDIWIDNNCTTLKWNIEISQVAFIENVNSDPSHLGGGLCVFITGNRISTTPTCYLRISNCAFQSGVSNTGGGAYILATFTVDRFDDVVNETTGWVSILDSHFIGNIGLYGGGLAIHILYLPSSNELFYLNALVSTAYVENTTFTDNAAWSGSAVYITHSKLNSLAAGGLQHFIFQNCSFRNNHHNINASLLSRNARNAPHHESVYFMYIQNVTISNCEFIQNNGTALTAEQSNIIFTGDVLFRENYGTFGGALFLSYSFQFILPQTNLIFLNNHAERFGGAIYYLLQVYNSVTENSTCFMTILALPQAPNVALEDSGVTVDFINNTAFEAGDALYGTPVDAYVCLGATTIYDGHSKLSSPQSSDSMLNFTQQTGSSIVASAAERVCFCEHGQHINCTRKDQSLEAFPGQDFTISVVAVGQRDGTVPTVLHANIKGTATMSEFQESQETRRYCTDITYTVFSSNPLEIIELSVASVQQLRSFTTILSAPQEVFVLLLSCPLGFTLTGDPPKCDCTSQLHRHSFTCDIHSQTIQRPGGIWVGYSEATSNGSNGTILLHEHCPFDYCIPSAVNMSFSNPDKQCAFNHSGILCGACTPGLSQVFGTSQCLKCSSAYLSLLIAFTVAGLALVVVLSKCNLTMSDGTLSGLILYVNIIQMNKAIFFTTESWKFEVFIAWLNLDLGIQTCFYDGMDMYAKVWLQFLFPLYIWLITLVMIVSSHYSSTAAKLVGRNAPKVLATLFLLSYSKLIKTVIAALSFTLLQYPNKQQAVWLYDGNVQYLAGKHIPLFLAAVFVLLLFFIPYTVLVLFTQCLQRSDNRVARWIMRRTKPILDAYTGPYKDRYRFWPGLLLLVRIFLLVAFAGNVSGDPSLNLVVVLVAVLCLLSASQWAFHGIYKQWPLEILESFFLMNTGILSAVTLYLKLSGGNQAIATDVSIGTAIVAFSVILFYHISTHTSIVKLRMKLSAWYKKRRHLHDSREPHELEDLVSGADSERTNPEEVTIQPQAQVQPFRLTFDEDGEPVLVPDKENEARVQRLTLDQDQERVLVIQNK